MYLWTQANNSLYHLFRQIYCFSYHIYCIIHAICNLYNVKMPLFINVFVLSEFWKQKNNLRYILYVLYIIPIYYKFQILQIYLVHRV